VANRHVPRLASSRHRSALVVPTTESHAMPIVLFDGSNSVGTPVSERRTGREGAVREHPIDGRAGLAFVDKQHRHTSQLLLVPSDSAGRPARALSPWRREHLRGRRRDPAGGRRRFLRRPSEGGPASLCDLLNCGEAIVRLPRARWPSRRTEQCAAEDDGQPRRRAPAGASPRVHPALAALSRAGNSPARYCSRADRSGQRGYAARHWPKS
jgi:hypothetical protein